MGHKPFRSGTRVHQESSMSTSCSMISTWMCFNFKSSVVLKIPTLLQVLQVVLLQQRVSKARSDYPEDVEEAYN